MFLLGAAPLLWVTRLVRRQALVYLGLAQLVAGTLDLSSCAAGWNNPAVLAGWLAVTAALLGLALWAAGVASRRLEALRVLYRALFPHGLRSDGRRLRRGLEARGLGREAYGLPRPRSA